MNKRYIFSIIIATTVSMSAMAQKPEKAFDDIITAMSAKDRQPDVDNNMDKARIALEKIILKDSTNAMANMGLAIVYSYDKYTQKDYFKGWYHFKKADASISAFTPDDLKVLDAYFMKQKLERRGKPIAKNMEIERNLTEEKLIKFVREENNLEYAEKFLKEFPDSKYYNNVVHIRNYIEFRTAENTATVEAFNKFLQKYPESAQFAIATEERDALAFALALSENTYKALKDFVDNYPKSIQYEEAKKKLAVLAYEEVVKKNTIEAVEDFIANYPNSPKIPDAKLLKRQLLFDWAKSVNSIEAYNKFVAQYPEGEMFVDIFNLKSSALGQQIASELPVENYKVIRGFDNNQSSDYGGSIAVYPDGNVMVIANTPSLSDDMDDVWMIKLDATGKMISNDIVGNDFDDRVNSVIIDKSGSLYGAGLTNAIKGNALGQSWLFKMNAQGKNVFNAKFEGNEVLSMVIYDDGKSLLGGYVQDNDTATPTPMLTKLNAQGRKLWTRTYEKGGKVTAMAVDGNLCSIALNGSMTLQIDELGYIKWDNIAEGCRLSSVAISNGVSVYTGVKDNAGYAMAINANGQKQWETTFEIPADGTFTKSCVLADGSVVSGGTFGDAVVLVKVDAKGTATVKTFNGGKQMSFNGIATATDNDVWVSATYANDIVVFKLGL